MNGPGLSLAQYYDCAFRLLGQAQQLDKANVPSCVLKYREACGHFRTILSIETEVAKQQLISQQLTAFEARITVLEGNTLTPPDASALGPGLVNGLPVAPSGSVRPASAPAPAQPTPQAQPQPQPHPQQSHSKHATSVFESQLQLDAASVLENALLLDERLKLGSGAGTRETDEKAVQQCIDAYLLAAEKHLDLVKRLEREGSGANRARVVKLKGALSSVMDRISDLKVIRGSRFTSLASVDSLLDSLPDVPRFVGADSASGGGGEMATDTLPGGSGGFSAPPGTSEGFPAAATPLPTPGSLGAGGFSGRELAILKRSSVVNGHVYQPWVGAEEERECFRTNNGQPFCDPGGLPALSAAQVKVGAIWLRPREILAVLEENQKTLEQANAARARQQEEAQNAHLRQSSDAPEAPQTPEAPEEPAVPEAPGSSVAGEGTPVAAAKPVMVSGGAASASRITQDMVSDCSFVCSLCVTAAFEERFHRQLITKVIYPQNGSNTPLYNAYGKYLVRLYINGVARKVIIDDRLPFDPVNKKLLCSCSQDPKEFWISLVEKAYLKLNGGYDFPGSNSGIDLYCLTGWIPEQIWFSDEQKRKDMDRKSGGHIPAGAVADPPAEPAAPVALDHRQSADRAWERLASAFKYGDCLVTISTSDSLSAAEEEATGLVPCHAYAVLDVRQAGNLRMLQVKNPWSRRPWKGRFSATDKQTRWTDGLRKALGLTSQAKFDQMARAGVFWIEFSDVRLYFKSFFLNWNPQLFAFRTVVHDCWPAAQGPANDAYYMGSNPQYTLIVDNNGGGGKAGGNKGSMWVLFSRHLTVKQQTENNRTGTDAEAASDDSDYFAVHVFKGDGSRLYAADSNPTIKGIYNNDPHTLIRFDTGDLPGVYEESFTLVLSQLNKKRDCYYTISLFSSNQPFRFHPSTDIPAHQLKIKGLWSDITSGGTSRVPTFFMNPQYRVIISGPVSVDLHIQALFPKETSALIYLVAAAVGDNATDSDHNGNPNVSPTGRVDSVDAKEALALSSEAYRPGFVFCKGTVAPGVYTAVFSTWTAKTMVGPFMATFACSSLGIKITEVPPEGQGWNCHSIQGAWAAGSSDYGTAAGCNNHGNYLKNPLYRFQVSSSAAGRAAVKVFARLQCTNGTPFAINVSLYPCNASHGSGGENPATWLPHPKVSPKRALATSASGVYSDATCGVVLPITEVEVVSSADTTTESSTGVYCIIPSTFAPLECSTFSLNVYTSGNASAIRFI